MLPLTSVDVSQLLGQVVSRHFAELPMVPAVRFVQSGPLASIVYGPERRPAIYLHAVLNHADVPEYVFEYILKHELIHLEVPPRQIAGRRVGHPPEFFERECRIAPERSEAWGWLLDVLGHRLRIRKSQDCMEVRTPRRRPRLAGSAPTSPPDR